MKELGDYLKEIRENNCVSIEEAADDLKLDKKVLENVECGNSKAFKEILELKNIVKKYAKYLGLNPEKVVDEFNDFLFEHTSKINLKDILEAEKKESNKKKIISPYTKIKSKGIKKEYVQIFLIVVLMIALIIFALKIISKPTDEIIVNELKLRIGVNIK